MANALRRMFTRNKRVSPASEGVLIEGIWDTCRAIAFPSDETILVPMESGTLDEFSLRTGERLHSYKAHLYSYPRGQILLDDDTVATVGYGKIVVSRLSDGTELDRVGIYGWCCAPLRDRCFLVGTESGIVQEVQCGETGKFALTRNVSLADSRIDLISVCRNRFAACSKDGNVIGVFELSSFKCIALGKEQRNPTCLHLTDDLLVVGDGEGQIFVYDSLSLEIVHKIQNHNRSRLNSVHLLDDGRHVLSAYSEGLICIQNLETDYLIWQKQLNEYIYFTKALSHGRLLTSFVDKLLLHSFPHDGTDVTKLTLPPTTPLRDALESCISGAEKPSKKCKKLITFDRTSASFDEWCCGHRLLMMAVEDGDIPQSPDYDEEVSYWFKNMYLAAKEVQKASEDDIRTIERFLVEAEGVGLVRSIEPIVVAMRLTKDLREEVGALQRADILMLNRLLSIEARLEKLKESFERYRKYVRTSQLIGVALQIIPIAGGSAAGVVSAGVDIAEGLSAKDLTDYFLGLGSNLLLDEIPSMSDRVFSSAAAALSPEKLEKMNAEHRRKLEEGVRMCGMSLRALRELFIEKAERARERGDKSSEEHGTAGGVDGVEVVVEEAEEETELLMLESGGSEDIGGPGEKTTPEIESTVNSPTDSASRGNKEGLPVHGPSGWKDFEFYKDVVIGLSREEMASLLAAYLVCNDDDEQEEYEMLRKCLHSVFRKQHLRAELMVDSSNLPAEELFNAITDGIERNGVEVTVGIRATVRKFVSVVQRNG